MLKMYLSFDNIARLLLLRYKMQNFPGEQQNQLKPEFPQLEYHIISTEMSHPNSQLNLLYKLCKANALN